MTVLPSRRQTWKYLGASWGTASVAQEAAAGTLVLLWLAALWQSWEFKGLYADGSLVLLQMLNEQGFTTGPFDPRAHAVLLAEAPVVLAMKLGVVDIRWLARALSFGYCALPTALYSLALLRARRDPVVLAITIAATAIVFMTTSFHVGCESGPAYSSAILIAVWLATARRITTADGIALVVIAGLSTRLYEHYVYLGPLLALMTAWSIASAPVRPRLATTLYGIAAALLIAAAIIAAQSLLDYVESPADRKYLVDVVASILVFRYNLQLDLLLLAAALVLLWGVLRPGDLARSWPYLLAGVPVLLVALSPLLVVAGRLVAPPYSWSQQPSRTVAGPLAALAILLIWLYASRLAARLPMFAVVKQPRAAASALLFASAMLVATLPWDAMLTILYGRYVEVVRQGVRTGHGVIEADRSFLEGHPRLAHHDFAVSSLSIILRTTPRDIILVPPGEPNSKEPIDPAAPPDLGRFLWRD